MFTTLRQTLTRRVTLPFLSRLETARTAFSKTEKILFGVFGALLSVSVFFLTAHLAGFFLIEVPRAGGSLTEGIIGTPRFINPLLAVSDADRDLTALVYAGLLKTTLAGELVPELAEKYYISDDGRSYTFVIKENARFHDGTRVTADDVLYTVSRAQDPLIKSVKRANWEGVGAEKVNEHTVRFTLKQAYAPFLENATLGILPKHLWRTLDTESFQFSPLNREPVGAGPYRVFRVIENEARIPIAYDLSVFADYALGHPFISNITVRFYGNETALVNAFERKEIESMGGVGADTAARLSAQGITPLRTPLPRVFGIFFNQNQSRVLTDKTVRAGLDAALDKEALLAAALGGFGTPLAGPLPPLVEKNVAAPVNAETLTARTVPTGRQAERALALFASSGWTYNKENGTLEKKEGKGTKALSFSLATASTPELKRAAEFAATAWRALGVQVELRFFEVNDLNQTVIRPRTYDALLFGEIVGRDADLFAFWHSSQRNDPGLNIALYANIKADRLLEEARSARDKDKRDTALSLFAAEIAKDIPAIFLYTPDYIYFLPQKIRGVEHIRLTLPHERWNAINTAYIKTEKIWPFSFIQ